MHYWAVGSHTSKAVGQGVHGGRSPLSQKIEMFSDGMVEYSDKQNTKTMAATSTMTLGNGDDLVWKSLGWSRTESAKMSDGSFYKGYLDRFGNRTGTGVWRSPMTIFGAYDPQNIKSMFHWTEYEGEWKNDLPNGFGELRKCCGDGTKQMDYHGSWVNGAKLTDLMNRCN